MFGTSQGNHVTPYGGKSTPYTGERLHNPERNPPMSVPFGNRKAVDVGKGGPGKGYTVYERGMQDCHGQPASGNPRPNPRRDALEGE
jgi:hypothetical protein